MTHEEGSLWNWVRMQPKFVFVNELMYDFEYKGVMCRGVKTVLPYTEELRIMPFNYNDVISDNNAAGDSVFKSFKRKITTE